MAISPMAHVYHRTLDPNSEDSLAKLARQVRPGSHVLDLGAGPGVLGRYLTEQCACVVDGVECHPVAVAAAAPWYRHLECADLEQITLAHHFADGQYDVILCADILEHLRRPEALLAQLPELLTADGQILLSVPNVAYVGLIAEMLIGDFRYRPEGLLDETHLRFFTRISLLRLLAASGLQPVALDATVMDLAYSEFASDWVSGGWVDTVSPDVMRALLDRPEALIYQFLVAAVPAARAHEVIEQVPAAAVEAAQATLAARLAVPSMRPTLTIALVTYAPNLAVLAAVLEHLARALRHAQLRWLLTGVQLTLVDNGPGSGWREPLQGVLDAAPWPTPVELLSGQGNVGYGAAHNLAFHRGTGNIHLILNPDVLLAEDALSEGLAFLAAHPEAGLVAPAAQDGEGRRQFLCKRYPTLLDLALRGFASTGLQQRFQARLERYEWREQAGDAVLWDPPIASGCFMLCRRAALKQVGGFQPDYFLYFEDFDLSLRLATVTRLAYVPQVRIVHLGGHAARKGWHHIGLFVRSAVRFFHRHGWRWW